MAIAIMKRLTILCEPQSIEPLLACLQEVQETQVTSFTSLTQEDQAYFEGNHQMVEVRLNDEMQLRQLRDAIQYLREFVPPKHWRSKFEARPVYSLAGLEEKVASLNVTKIQQMLEMNRQELSTIQKNLQSLYEEELFLRQWSSLKMNPALAKDLAHFNVKYGTIPAEQQASLMTALDEWHHDYFIEDVFYTKDTIGYVIVTKCKHRHSLGVLLRQNQWSSLHYRYDVAPKEALKENLEKREANIQRDLVIKRHLKEAASDLEALILAEEALANRIERYRAQEAVLKSQHLTVLQAWLEETKVEGVLKTIKEVIDSEALAVFVNDAKQEEIEANEVPTKLTNHWLSRPFEALTLQYGIPSYQSIDPTPYYTLFQILFFGLMSADFGYGLLLFIGTLIASKMTTLSASMKQSMKMFQYSAVGTMLVGLFFGSFFGFDLPFKVMNLSNNVIGIMVFSVAIGLMHMLIGYGLKARLSIREKEYTSMYLDAVQWMLMIIGGILLALNTLLKLPIVQQIGLVLLLGNIAGMFIVNILTTKNKFVGFGKGLFGLIDVAGLVGDIVSYTRLTALAVSGANIGMAFNLIVGLLPPVARFSVGLVLFIVLHALNIFITFLGAYVHSMRLQFVEFFGKFFESGGRLFTPLKPQEKHIQIRRDN